MIFTKMTSFLDIYLENAKTYKPIDKEEAAEGFNYEEVLSYSLQKSSMQVSLLTLNKGAKRKMVTTEGFEYIYLIKGAVRYELETHKFDMEEGDSLFFDGRLNHVPRNIYDGDSIFLVIYFISM